MYPKCAYYKCGNKNGKIGMFRFPVRNPDQLKIWIRNSGNVFLDSLTPQELKHRYLCAAHFSESSIHRGKKRSRLIGIALPFQFESVEENATDKCTCDSLKRNTTRFPWNEETCDSLHLNRNEQPRCYDRSTRKKESLQKTNKNICFNTDDMLCFDCEENNLQQDKRSEINSPTVMDNMDCTCDPLDLNSPKAFCQDSDCITSLKTENEENLSDENEYESQHLNKIKVADPLNHFEIVGCEEFEASQIKVESQIKEEEALPPVDSHCDQTERSKCQICERYFDSDGELRTHQTKCAVSFVCKLCHRHFDTISQLTMHILMTKEHVPEPKSRLCPATCCRNFL